MTDSRPTAETGCGEFVEMAMAFVDGALDPEQERRVVDHARECEGCALFLDRLRRTISALDPPRTQRPST
jgi:hypothetical protein